jgi:Photosynthetic reaction centre cytochrome C subunit
MKKSYLIILSCFISVFIFQAFTSPKVPPYKNLKILSNDISEHDLDSVMRHFTASLGVKCNFCHVRNEDEHKMDFASDDKPEKMIARKMMLMAIDINKNYFKMDRHMDHDHDMNNNMDKDHAMNNDKDHDKDMNKDMDHHDMDHDMDTSSANSARFMLRSVTCYTCHRGDAHPERKPVFHQDGPPPPPEPPKPAESK